MSDAATNWIRACPAAAVKAGEPKGVTLRDTPIALYRLDDGVYATHGVCTHAYSLLAEGYIEGETVECALHGAFFDIRTGKCLAVADADLRTYPVRVDGDAVWVGMPDGDAVAA